MQKLFSSLGGLEPPTFRLTAERANRLRHRDDDAVRFYYSPFISPPGGSAIKHKDGRLYFGSRR